MSFIFLNAVYIEAFFFRVSDTCDGMLSSMPMTIGSTESLVEGVLPLSSKVVNKLPSSMDGQYMQQQNQVFVFSTALANKSADAVQQGKFKTIIDFHRAQRETKQYLMVIEIYC